MTINFTGMIYDRMVQNARNSASDDWEGRECDRPGARERRLRRRREEELAAMRAAHEPESPSASAPETNKPERLFGDPLPKQDWPLLRDIAGYSAIALIIASLFVLLFTAMGEASSGNGKSKRAVPVEVEK